MWSESEAWRLEVAGCRLQVGSWKLEVGGWRLEVGSWRSDGDGWSWRPKDIRTQQRRRSINTANNSSEDRQPERSR
ncbi:hypothetical protein K490DRAFT_42346 [Saccharata proteae CBS 121410]|uniref:Phosphotransferase n=1 Tax=Saccharata proteae CBS 121410 TaxID=1314787 RepID=A0A9P4LZX6_9PEZI|nr:hypothetical protein K490DRAFT_42346 [Saccharata proteae CBS 121410]